MNEAVMRTLFKALGIDPQEIVKQIQTFAEKAVECAERLQTIEKGQADLKLQLDRIEARLYDRKAPTIIDGK